MRGKTVLVTGASAGIGAVTVRRLAAMGATVAAVGRDRDRTDALVERARAETPGAAVDGLLADLSSQVGVRRLADEVLDRYPRLDVLVNNAGAIFFGRQESVDGVEMTFALNHLGYFLLTGLLLERLKASAPARVVNVSSAAHRRGRIDFDDLQSRRGYGGWAAYSNSKLANLLFTYELARRLEGTGVTVNALHPGLVATRFGANNGWLSRALRQLANLFSISAEEGARTVVYLASSPDVEGVTGKYFVRERAAKSIPASHDGEAAARLWRVSEELTGASAS